MILGTTKFPRSKERMQNTAAFILSAMALCALFFIPERNQISMIQSTLIASPMKEKSAFSQEDGIKQVQSVSSIVAAANAFKNSLTAAQITTLQLTFTNTLAKRWSNLPCGAGCRNGLQFSTLTPVQLDLALAVIKEAAGTSSTEGYSEFLQINAADSLLGLTSPGGYSKGIYFIAFLNAPSTTGPWMLQYGGHHIGVNIAFNGGNVVGCTPMFEGVEPRTFTRGLAVGPLENEHAAMSNMLASLDATQLATAKLSTNFGDVLLGPNQDGNFPTTKLGIKCSNLSASQQNLVMLAMNPWLNDIDDATAATLRSIYQGELANTYISYTGAGVSGNANSFLSANSNYARIDGPSVWIEFVCQNGFVFSSDIHYHSVWRDHTRDYGNYLSSTSLTGISTIDRPVQVSVYPNPATNQVRMELPDFVVNAAVLVTDVSGRTVLQGQTSSGNAIELNVQTLSTGSYFIHIKDEYHHYLGRFVK
jgi:Protein of unknown function (DUF3500)/Secretion system C-terminal sorting domain